MLTSVLRLSTGLALLSLPARAMPSIMIESLPPYGVDGFLTGHVSGAEPSGHRVATYLQIEGAGWWTKPTSNDRTVEIEPDGSFSVDVATGGLDNRATIYCAALVASDTTPPLARGGGRIPADLERVALDCRERYARTIEFAGRTWAVKEAPDPVGPGQNRFSMDPADVFVDPDGALHLRLSERGDHWYASEVILLEHLGHGTYSFETSTRLDTLDAKAVFGAFTWDAHGDGASEPGDPHREIDSEDSRWGDESEIDDSQFVLQPYTVPGNRFRFPLPDLSGDAALTRSWTWRDRRIDFIALQGHVDPLDPPPRSVIHESTVLHDGITHIVPSAGRERMRFNLWLHDPSADPEGPAPVDGETIEVVIDDFEFTPVPEPSLSAGMAACAGLLALLARLRALRASFMEPEARLRYR